MSPGWGLASTRFLSQDLLLINHWFKVRSKRNFLVKALLGSSLLISRRNGDYITGRFMMHCHNLVHEDHSMMTQFEVGQDGDSPCSAPPLPISEMRSL